MQNSDSVSIIPFSTVKVSDADHQQLLDELFKLRQKSKEMARAVALQKELVQQLRDENARLRG